MGKTYRHRVGPNDGLRGIPDRFDVVYTDEHPEGCCHMDGFSPYHWYHSDSYDSERWAYDSKLGLYGGGVDGEIYRNSKDWYIALAHDLSECYDELDNEGVRCIHHVFSTLDEARDFVEVQVAKFWQIYDPDRQRWRKDWYAW